MGNKKALLVSCDLPLEIEKTLGFLGYGCVRLPKFDELDAPVSSHPDILFYRLKSGKLLCDENYFKANSELLINSGSSFVFSEKHLGKKYPNDILFDALTIDGTVYGRTDYIAPEILKDCKRTVKLKQGYTACATRVAGKIALTSDPGISAALKNDGFNVLHTEEKILLPGYGCGFIGGASFYDEDSGTVVFFGEPEKNSSIPDFLKDNGINAVYTEGIPLTDYGSAIIIK